MSFLSHATRKARLFKLMMKKIIFILPVILFFACGEEEEQGEKYDPARTERYVKYNNGKFENYWLVSSHKAKAFFTPGACIYDQDSVYCDTASIMRYMNQLIERGFAKQEQMTMNITGNNDSLVEQGRYVLRDTSGKVAEQGGYTTTWKRHRGYFKYHRILKTRS